MSAVAVIPPQQMRAGKELLDKLWEVGAATDTSLELPPGITYLQFEALGVALARGYRNWIWLLADWLNQGEHLFKSKIDQAVEATGLNFFTLDNYARTARQVPPERRVPGVPFSVHTEVAPLEPTQQTLWLEKAKANEWRREDLRAELRPIKLLTDDELPTPAWEIDPLRVEQAARDLLSSARSYGDNFLIPRYAYQCLMASLNEGIVV